MAIELLLSAAVGLFAAILGAGVVVLGWIVVHRQEMRRDLAVKRRELRVAYLIDAYRRIERGANRKLSRDQQLEVESAIADVQLLGTPGQVKHAQDFVASLIKDGSAPTYSLLEEFRKSLRNELELEEVPTILMYMRFKEEQQDLGNTFKK